MRERSDPSRQGDVPTRGEALAFRVKAALFQLRRAARNLVDQEVRRFPAGAIASTAVVLGESRTPLWTEAAPEERALVAGKIENLRRAAARLNGVVVPAGRIFGFWAHIGRPTRRRGYVEGRELREGCLVPSVGGGLCQLSNALYDAALTAGFEIVERHAHSRVIPGSLAESGRDATVFWNYVDLRFRAPRAFRIEVELDAASLIVALRGQAASARAAAPVAPPPAPRNHAQPNSCVTCGVAACFRNRAESSVAARTAFLLDETSPEFDAFVQAERRPGDALFLPLDGKRRGRAAYAWTTQGFATVHESVAATLWRAWRSRRLAREGAARQRAQIAAAERLARSYASRLDPAATHLVVAQNLLPHLHRLGVLGGRSYDVLASALPMDALQNTLDRAAARHRDSATLADFRAEPDFVAEEQAAFRRARRIVTPHALIAARFGERALRLDWAKPARPRALAAPGSRRLIFPAATLGRKGAPVLRQAIAGLDVTLVALGASLEKPGFWEGHRIEARPPGADWLAGAAAVVLPAYVEHKPRRLLEALAAGVPAIATAECGIPAQPGLILVPAGDAASLRAAIRRALGDDDLAAAA